MCSSKKIIHCDADCFFVAIEIRDDTELKGLPVAVGGDSSKRGVISTCNYEARAFGVHSAMASAYAKRLCPQLIILPHHMQKYRDAAIKMREIFADYTDIIEPVSLDEAYLDVTDSSHCLGSATFMAKELRRRLEKEIGITVSAGVGSNKFIAKVASDWQKPNGLTVIDPSQTQLFVKKLPVNCIPGVGPACIKKLSSRGIFFCEDLQKLSQIELIKQFGLFGKRLYQFSRGEDERPVKRREHRKSLSVEHTFNTDIDSVDTCSHELVPLFDKMSKRFKETNCQQGVKSIFIKLTFEDFQKTSLETAYSEWSVSEYQRLLVQLFNRHKKAIRLIGLGVRFNDNDVNNVHQLELFHKSMSV